MRTIWIRPVVTSPGVYIEELPSGVPSIAGTPTSITAFVGRAWKGPVDEPVTIASGALQGTTPREAYFVKCDRETTTHNDIDAGLVNILAGFAPLTPAEFVVMRIQQLAARVRS